MKILYILPLLLFCNVSFSQELPDIPMKNNLIYYNLRNKHNNQKQCLAKLLHTTGLNDDYNIGIQKRIHEKQKEKFYINNSAELVQFKLSNWSRNGRVAKGDCFDTLTGDFSFNLVGGIGYFDMLGAAYGIGKSKPISKTITAEVTIVFISKNEYEMRFKKFMLNKFYMDATTTNLSLSEYYLDLKNNDKITKKEAKFFLEFDDLIKICNEACWEELKFLIENDELD